MEDCIFCKIVKGEIDSAKIWEDKDFLAILDKNPNIKGMTLVLTKKHYDSNVFNMSDDVYQRFILSAKKVAKILEKGLSVKRVVMVIEGTEINHAHIKLYPLFPEKYKGYISTKGGPEVELSELKKLAEEIKF